MFTGLVQTLGKVQHLREDGSGGCRLSVSADFSGETTLGESVAVNGVCLTVVERTAETMTFELGPETLQRSNLGKLQQSDGVNLERSLRVGDHLGGHFVQGHVDGVGFLEERIPSGPWQMLWFRVPAELTVLMVPKGSIAVDGISLTLVEVESDRFSVMLIPHTLEHTTLGFRRIGDEVNLEADMLAKHVARLLAGGLGKNPEKP